MSAVSLADKKRLFFEDHTGLSGKSITDLEWEYYSTRSGLTPRGRYSIADHKRAYFESQTGLSGRSMSHLEREFYVRKGISLGPISSMASDYFFSPREYNNLELALEADKLGGAGTTNPADAFAVSQWNDLSGKGRHVTQSDAAKQPKFRNANPNKMSYDNATGISVTSLTPAGGSITVEANEIKYTPDGVATQNYFRTRAGQTGFPVESGKQYTAIFSARSASSTEPGSGRVSIYWYDSTGANFSANHSSDIPLTTALTKITITATAPATAVYAAVFFWFSPPGTALAATAIQYADFLSFAEGTSTTWVPPVVLPNNQPVVQFDGLDDFLNFIGNFGAWPKRTAYLVTERVSGSGTAPVFSGANVNWYSGFGSANNSALSSYTDSTPAQKTFKSPIGSAGPAIISTVFDIESFGAGIVKRGLFFNGAGTPDTDSNGAATPTSTSWLVGSYLSTQLFFPGNIAVVYVYSRAHDDFTRKRIERALGAKYGIVVA